MKPLHAIVIFMVLIALDVAVTWRVAQAKKAPITTFCA